MFTGMPLKFYSVMSFNLAFTFIQDLVIFISSLPRPHHSVGCCCQWSVQLTHSNFFLSHMNEKNIHQHVFWASLVAQMFMNPPVMQETRVRSLGWEDPLEKRVAAHSSTLAWRIPWTEEPRGLQSMGLQRVRHD